MTVTMAAVVCVVVGATSVLGGVTGFGAALLATPLLLVIGMDVTDTVVVNLMIGLATRCGTAAQLFAAIDRRCVALLSAGCLLGILVGAITLDITPQALLKFLAGIAVIVCGVMMARRVRAGVRQPTRSIQFLTGLLSGYLSATTSLTGPAPALMLLRSGTTPVAFIANISGYLIVACAATLAVLAVQGGLTGISFWPWMPALIVTAVVCNRLGLKIAHHVKGATFQAIVATLVIVAGIGTCVTAL